jgi:hypothetical protein
MSVSLLPRLFDQGFNFGARPRNEDPKSEGVREGRVELPRPFGHRILRLVQPGTDPDSTCRPVSSDVVLCHPVSSRREQAVSRSRAGRDLRLREADSADREGWKRKHEEGRWDALRAARLVPDGGPTPRRPGTVKRMRRGEPSPGSWRSQRSRGVRAIRVPAEGPGAIDGPIGPVGSPPPPSPRFRPGSRRQTLRSVRQGHPTRASRSDSRQSTSASRRSGRPRSRAPTPRRRPRAHALAAPAP